MSTPVNILLVDDEPRNLDVLESVLQSPDYYLVRAQKAEDALIALLDTEFAAIVLDIQMPGMNGIEMAHLVKQRKRTRHIPIIFLTAYFQEDKDVLQGYEVGAVDYLTKPINAPILKSKVAVFADLFRKTRALAATNAALEQQVHERQKAEEALRTANNELEIRVRMRTVDLVRANAELAASEDRYRRLVQMLPAAVYTCDYHGRILLYNRAAVALWGREPEVGKDLWCGSHRILRADGTALPLEESPMAVTLREGRAVRGQEIIIERPDGTRRDVLPYPDPIRDSLGIVVGAVNMLVDITEHKQAEQSIRRLNADLRRGLDEFQALIKTAPVGIAVATDPECRHVWANPEFAQMLGTNPEANVSKTDQDQALPFKVYRNGKELAAGELPMQRACQEGVDVLDEEYEVERADGTLIHEICRATPLRDEAGRVRGCIGVFLDITARKQAELAARESEARFRLMADNAPVLIWIADTSKDCVWFNQRWLDFVGKSLEREVGSAWMESLHPEDRDRCVGVYHSAFEVRRAFEVESRLRRADGEYRWVLGNGVPMFDPEKEFTGYIGSCVDITELKHAQQTLRENEARLSAASRAKDDFLATLSHELRTPLSPVLLLASEGAANTSLPAQVRNDFDTIRKNVELEARLIDDLLDLTRIVRGKLPLELKPQDPHAILHDVLRNVRAEMDQKGIELALQLSVTCPPVLADDVRLQQIFWNVIKNAVKFTPARGTITIQTSVLTPPGRMRFQVTDTGLGMTAEEIERAFNAFAQGDHAENGGLHRYGGIGLGLTISRMLVKLQNGSIRAVSDGRGRGSTFIVELPLAQPGEPARPSQLVESGAELASPPVVPPHPPRRVLLVEDHEPTRSTLAHLLGRRNYEVTTAGSVAEARSLAESAAFDLLISDIGLPDGNGYELMSLLRSQHGLRGIALTGYGMERDISRSQAAGFVAHLTKPVRVQSLESALASVGTIQPPPETPS